jgi:hypothetical protein
LTSIGQNDNKETANSMIEGVYRTRQQKIPSQLSNRRHLSDKPAIKIPPTVQ